MTKKKNRRIGQGMKSRGNVSDQPPASAGAGQPEVQKEPIIEQETFAVEAKNDTPDGGSLETATVQNLDSETPAADVAVSEERKNLEELLRDSVDARSGEDPERCPSCGYTEEDAGLHGDHHLCNLAGQAPWEKPKPTIGELEDLIVKTDNQVRIEPDGTVKAFPVGERPDGTFGLVVTVREGMIESIRQQAEADKQEPEEWVSERFGEWLEQWWAPPQGK